MVKKEGPCSLGQQWSKQGADRPICPPCLPVVWRYTKRHSADLSGLRALKKYR
jgi:hypothetical protein